MNLDLDLSVFSRFFRGIATELRQKRLLAGLAAVLVVALVAVPFLLSKSSSPAPAPEAQVPSTPPPAAGASIPTLNVQTTPQSHLSGPARDPFGASGGSTTTSSSTPSTTSLPTTVSTAVSTAAQGAVSTLTGNQSGGSSAVPPVPVPGFSGASTPLPSTTTTHPSATTPTRSRPSVTALGADQAYDVSLAITNASGGLNTLHGLKRLTPLPSSHKPLLVELGVLKGGHRVLFAVEPGTVVTGGGSCIPGPIDCQVLSLAANQTESVATGGGSDATVFEVTGIGKHTYASRTAAGAARQVHAKSGQAVLAKSSLTALSLFRYEPSVGAVVDLRTLSVRG